MEKWEIAIEKLEKLNAERRGPLWWSDNIIEAHEGLTEKRDCALFYRYLTSNRGQFDPNEEICTLDDIIGFEDMKIDPYPEGMEVTEYHNGPLETLIHVRNTKLYKNSNSDDEKTPSD